MSGEGLDRAHSLTQSMDGSKWKVTHIASLHGVRWSMNIQRSFVYIMHTGRVVLGGANIQPLELRK